MPTKMPAPAVSATKWSHHFETAKREDLFRHPPIDKTAYPFLQDAFRPHIDSFNAVFEEDGLLDKAIRDIGTKTFLDGDSTSSGFNSRAPRNRLSIRIKRWTLEKPMLPASNKMPTRRQVYPNECRERHGSYKGRFMVRLEWRVNGGEWKEEVRDMGHLPIMLRSNRCHLEGKSPAQMVGRREESEEFGGYFIVNGLEKLVRLLIVNKRNYPLALYRPSFQNRGPTYSAYGIQIRSVRPDQTSQSNVLHYLHDGSIIFRFSWRKAEYLVPVLMVMRALQDVTDRDIFESLLGGPGAAGLKDRQFVIDRVELLLRNYKTQHNMHGKDKHRAYLGSKFRPVLNLSDDVSDEDCGDEFMRKVVLPHLGGTDSVEDSNRDKFRMLAFMVRKLYALVEGECAVDNPDAVSNQEILLGGFLYGMFLKERLEEVLLGLRNPLLEWIRANPDKNFASPEFGADFRSKIMRKNSEDIGRLIDYFLATGNLSSPSGLDLQQVSGFTIVAEKLNFYRFISHFRCVHRGSFFAQLKTTAVRKLLPESWGFLCPVHTPDGAPCGLLNHLSHKCRIATKSSDVSAIPDLVAGMGVVRTSTASLTDSVVVQLDGKILGFCTSKQARVIGDTLRYWKVKGSHNVPRELEIGFIPNSNGGQYPGIYMFSHAARMYRPTKYLPLDAMDYVGPFEQPYMSIACTDPEIVSGDSTHVEYDPTHILSIVANQTPFSDFNQSPRNMYQCLSADHEVLTQTGWKSIAAVEESDQVMTMNLQTGLQQWNAVQATTRLAQDGPLYRLKSNGIDAVCNETHRWYLNTRDNPQIYTAYTTRQMINTELAAFRNKSRQGQWHRKSGTITHMNHKIPTVGRNGNALYTWPDCPWLPREFVRDESCNIDWCRFIGLVMGNGDIRHVTNGQGQECHYIEIRQCTEKPAANTYIEDLLQRLASRLSGFVVGRACVTGIKGKHTWTINHRGMYDFFLPMIRGPLSFNPLDDAMCRAYQTHHHKASSSSGNEHFLPVPTGWETSNWSKLRRWFYYSWLFLLARDQARAMIKGLAVADGEWALSMKAQKCIGESGCGGGNTLKYRLSTEIADLELLASPLINKGVIRVFSSSIPLTHDLSVLGLLAETRINFAVNHRKGEWTPSICSTANATEWRVSFAFGDDKLTVAAPKPKLYDNPRHDGFVYCLTVPNSNFLARRSIEYSENERAQEVVSAAQKPFYTGNCQMGKQSMGTPGTAISNRTDNKTYRLQCGQTPIVRPPLHNEYGLDNFPNGTNAIVAVISYTGYDMDDAMILNKQAHERGFGFGSIYKTKKVDLEEDGRKSRSIRTITKQFGFAPLPKQNSTDEDPVNPTRERHRAILDDDGLPHIGRLVNEGDILYASHSVQWDASRGQLVNTDMHTHFARYKEQESAFIEEVRVLGSEDGSAGPATRVSIKFRIPRSPIIGDKFSSRHGQKGVCSQKWPTQDMPFSESGMVPDVIINPHAFPSRMTIGMFVESLAGKAGALHGFAQDSTPFKFEDRQGATAVEYFGTQLAKARYNYYGNEPMYSGVTGEELHADIYIGLLYYQRLRHMVNDKFQVRTTGPVNQVTGQPVKGRSKGGGIRVGEMERDSLIAHGTAFLLQDRLMNCSDYAKTWICKKCGTFLSTSPTVAGYSTNSGSKGAGGLRGSKRLVAVRCRRCASKATGAEPKNEVWEDGFGERFVGGDDTTVVAVPGVLKYLDAELASMGVSMKFTVSAG